MADKKHPGFTTKAEHQKTVFFSRMCIIIKLHRKFVIENRLGFFERNAMFFLIAGSLCCIPFKLYHGYIVCTKAGMSSIAQRRSHRRCAALSRSVRVDCRVSLVFIFRSSQHSTTQAGCCCYYIAIFQRQRLRFRHHRGEPQTLREEDQSS